MALPTRTLESLLDDPAAPLGQLILTDAVGDGIADDTVAIQSLFDTAGVIGVITIPPGTYKVGDITLFSKGQEVDTTVEPPQATDAGGFTLNADGVIFVGGGRLIIDSSKRLTILGLDAPTFDLCIRGCYNSDFSRCRFRRRVYQDQPGTYFSSAYWNTFISCVLQTTIVEAAATFPVNAQFDFGCSHRGSATQGFSTTASFAFELNANQNAQNWVSVGGDFSYHGTDIISIGAANINADIELTFIGVYFDSDYPAPINRPGARIVTENCHQAGKFSSAANLKAAARGGQDAWEKTHTSGWEPYGLFNFVPNGDFAKEQAQYVGAGNAIGNANTAVITAQTGAGLMGRYLNIAQALTANNQVTFRSSLLPFTGKYTGQLMIRLAGGVGEPKQFSYGVNGVYADVIVTAEWTYVTLGNNTERAAGVVLDMLLRTLDGTAFNVDVCYVGLALGSNPPLFLPQWTPNFKQDDSQASRFRPGTGAGTRPIWTSGIGSPEGVVVAPRGSLYGQEDGNITLGLWVKMLNATNVGWYPLSPRVSVADLTALGALVGLNKALEVFVDSINRPVWRNAANNGWVYADGTTVVIA